MAPQRARLTSTADTKFVLSWCGLLPLYLLSSDPNLPMSVRPIQMQPLASYSKINDSILRWAHGSVCVHLKYLETDRVQENSIATDYVTEKLYDAFVAGCVPVYYGAPNIEDLLPDPDSIIDYRHTRLLPLQTP